jgi:hypothetical protein
VVRCTGKAVTSFSSIPHDGHDCAYGAYASRTMAVRSVFHIHMFYIRAAGAQHDRQAILAYCGFSAISRSYEIAWLHFVALTVGSNCLEKPTRAGSNVMLFTARIKKPASLPVFFVYRCLKLVTQSDRPHIGFRIVAIELAEIFIFCNHTNIFGEVIRCTDPAHDAALSASICNCDSGRTCAH